jgi:hypothetical protein
VLEVPLVGEDPKYMRVKAECHARGNLIDIMHKYFVDGKSYTLNNGKSAYVRFDPDVKNPMQCYKCLVLPTSKDQAHYADKCVKEQACGNCGLRAHLDDPSKCERKSSCINCPKDERNNHSSFDRKCPSFMAQKEELIRQEVFNITSKLYKRLPNSRRERYSEVVKKNNEISQVAQDMTRIKELSESHMSSLDRKFEEKTVSWDKYFNELKASAASTAEGMRMTLDETRNACSKISELVDRSIDIKLEETKDKLKKLESKAAECDWDISRIDGNMVTISEGLSQMQDGQLAYNEAINKRLIGVEKFMEVMKNNLLAANNGVAFWDGLEQTNE